MASDVSVYVPQLWVPDAAPGISAAILQALEDQVEDLSTQYNLHNGGVLLTDHPQATDSVRGFMSAADKAKLDLLDYEDEQPNNVAAVSSSGTDDDVPRGNHQHKILDARVVAIIGATIAATGQALPGAAWASRLGTNVARPANWVSSLVQVTGFVYYATVDAGDQFSARINVDGNVSGTLYQTGQAAEDEEQVLMCQHTRLTSEAVIDIDLEVQKNGATYGGSGKHISFNYHLIRAA